MWHRLLETWNLQGKTTVSYTHLDVYKRQAQLHLDDAVASSALRISFGEHTSKEDIDQFCYYLEESLVKLKKQR